MLKEDTVNPAESASSGCMAGFVFAVVVSRLCSWASWPGREVGCEQSGL